MRLGTLLLRDAVITLTQLEQSLRAQVLSGGRLGTNLVELGFLDLNTLGRYLARVLDLPLAIADRLEKADPDLIEELGAELADRHSAIPLGRYKNDSNVIAVVMSNPTDRRSIAALETHFDTKIQPYVAAELRLFYYLERYYSIRRRTRFTRGPKTNETSTPPPRTRERRSTQPFRGSNTAAPVSISPPKRRASTAPMDAEQLVTPLISLDEAKQQLDEAKQRDHIANAILRFSVGRFACSALFMVREGRAIGWLAQAPGLGATSLERLSIPLDGSSVFQAAHDSSKPYRGPALSVGHPYEKELWGIFALDYEPDDVHMVPLCLGERVVNLLYAHSLPGSRVSDEDAAGFIELAKRAEEAYSRLISTTSAE